MGGEYSGLQNEPGAPHNNFREYEFSDSLRGQADELVSRFPRELADIPGPFILAVSGGRDSNLLLYLFACLYRAGYLNTAPIAFHLHHGLRESAERDLEVAERECRRLDISFYFERRNVAGFSRRLKLGLEEGGRILRYRILARLAREIPGAMAVTGHHADDYLESLLMHLIRGGGPDALAGMDSFTTLEGVGVFRPLLYLSRSRIESLVAENNIPFCEDESNQDQSFLRNRLRKNVLPPLLREGLPPGTLWENFHERALPGLWDEARRPREGVSFLSLERIFFVGVNAAEARGALATAFRRLGLRPPDRNLLAELARQKSRGNSTGGDSGGDFRWNYQTGDYLIWAARSGPIWIFRKDSDWFSTPRMEIEPAAREGENSSVVVSIGDRSRRYEPGVGEEIRVGSAGLRTASQGAGGSQKLNKIYQSYRLPPPVRAHLPLVYDRREKRVVRICFSFWGDPALEDRLF